MNYDLITFFSEKPELLIGIGGAILLLISVGVLLFARRRVPQPEADDESAVAAGAASPWVAFRAGLAKTRGLLGARVRDALGRDRTLDASLTELEEALIVADAGVATTHRLLDALRRRSDLNSPDAVLAALKSEIRALLDSPSPNTQDSALRTQDSGLSTQHLVQPLVILVAGVNGVGKTTTIGKLAYHYRTEGKKVLLIAADTFRAAAAEQLEVWAQRVGCEMVKHQSGADPSAVAFDGVKAARARGVDVAIVDTAGRLHVKVNLMAELSKVARVIGRELPGAPHETYLVLDATTGQNALNQARTFQEALPLTGVILTKLDGTTKGGTVLAVKSELGLPIRYVGLGEGIEDLRPFDAEAFVEALFEESAS